MRRTRTKRKSRIMMRRSEDEEEDVDEDVKEQKDEEKGGRVLTSS